MVELEHPTIKHKVTLKYANWKVFFFGVIWFFWHRAWGDGILYWLTMIVTIGLAGFVWPFFAEKRLTESYQLQGYKIINQKPMTRSESPWLPILVVFVPILIVAIFSIVLDMALYPGYRTYPSY